MVIGQVSVNAFTNRDGEAAASLELRAREVRFLSGDRGSRDSTDGYEQSGGRTRESFAPPARRSSAAETRGEAPPSRSTDGEGDRFDEIDDIPF